MIRLSLIMHFSFFCDLKRGKTHLESRVQFEEKTQKDLLKLSLKINLNEPKLLFYLKKKRVLCSSSQFYGRIQKNLVNVIDFGVCQEIVIKKGFNIPTQRA